MPFHSAHISDFLVHVFVALDCTGRSSDGCQPVAWWSVRHHRCSIGKGTVIFCRCLYLCHWMHHLGCIIFACKLYSCEDDCQCVFIVAGQSDRDSWSLADCVWSGLRPEPHPWTVVRRRSAVSDFRLHWMHGSAISAGISWWQSCACNVINK